MLQPLAERRELIASFGATIVPVSREAGGFLGSIRLAEELAARPVPGPRLTVRQVRRAIYG